MEDGQHGAVGFGGEKLVELPACSQGAGLGLPVAHDAGSDEPGVIGHGAESMGKAVAQLAALIDGAGRLRGNMGGNAAGEGELLE